MAFPFGGSLTHAQLAAKFGWFSVIISIVFLPFLMLWSKLLAFPVWISWIFPSGPFYMIKNILVFPGNEDVMRKEVYSAPTSVSRTPPGWNCLTDVEGKKFYEAFWGIIQCLDLDTTEEKFVVTPNVFTWLLVSRVNFDFPPSPVYENTVRFYFPLKGPNMINPFCWVTLMFGITGIMWFGKWSYVPFKTANGITTLQTMFPPDEPAKKLNADNSFKKYELQDAKKIVGLLPSKYGAVGSG